MYEPFCGDSYIPDLQILGERPFRMAIKPYTEAAALSHEALRDWRLTRRHVEPEDEYAIHRPSVAVGVAPHLWSGVARRQFFGVKTTKGGRVDSESMLAPVQTVVRSELLSCTTCDICTGLVIFGEVGSRSWPCDHMDWALFENRPDFPLQRVSLAWRRAGNAVQWNPPSAPQPGLEPGTS